MKLLNRYEGAILKVLHSSMRPMSTREISEKTGISWVTVKKYLQDMAEKKELVKRRETAKTGILSRFFGATRQRTEWELNREGIFGTTGRH